MKKIIGVCMLTIGMSIALHAQQNEMEGMTVAQQTDLAVKKMTLQLDLTDAQQNDIKPLVATKTAQHKKMVEKRKAMKEKKQRPSADERYAMLSKKMDQQIVFKREMKRILNEKQYEKFEKMMTKKMYTMKKKAKRKMHKEKKDRR